MSIRLDEYDDLCGFMGMSRRERRRRDHVARILESRGYSEDDPDYIEEFHRVYQSLGRWGSTWKVRSFGYPTDGTGDARAQGRAVLARMVADGVDVDRLGALAGRGPWPGLPDTVKSWVERQNVREQEDRTKAANGCYNVPDSIEESAKMEGGQEP